MTNNTNENITLFTISYFIQLFASLLEASATGLWVITIIGFIVFVIGIFANIIPGNDGTGLAKTGFSIIAGGGALYVIDILFSALAPLMHPIIKGIIYSFIGIIPVILIVLSWESFTESH